MRLRPQVSEKSGASLRSCRRQFDNIRRIHKACDEMAGLAATNIANCFHLSPRLAKSVPVTSFLPSLYQRYLFRYLVYH